ncbi:MAG: LEA type 2 family protein [Woeseiaceae bacterium]
MRFSHFIRSATGTLFVLALTALSACAGLRPGFETPTVTFTSFRMLPSTGIAPEFEIGLRVTNPNAEQLKLKGIAYSVTLDGKELIKGVSNELPFIDGYGSGNVTLTAAPDMIAGIRFVTDLISGSRDTVSYGLEAKLDVGTFIPPIRVRDEGKISLRPQAK